MLATDPRAKRGAAPGLIIGGRAIAAHIGVSRATLYRWIDNYAFPVGKSPGGLLMTTPQLIAAWALAIPKDTHERDTPPSDAQSFGNPESDRIGFP